ncbi:MAG: hypothetical protein OIF48_20740 [Silicimonas sp.]|nr:hypothetical protein [Silicimonas sp.]
MDETAPLGQSPQSDQRNRRRAVTYAGFLDHDELMKMLDMADAHMANQAQPKGLLARAFGRKPEAA